MHVSTDNPMCCSQPGVCPLSTRVLQTLVDPNKKIPKPSGFGVLIR